MFQPTPEWTEKDRLTIVSAIGATMMNYVQGRESIPGHEYYSMGDRIRHLGAAGPEFLEANRTFILEGLEPMLETVTAK